MEERQSPWRICALNFHCFHSVPRFHFFPASLSHSLFRRISYSRSLTQCCIVHTHTQPPPTPSLPLPLSFCSLFICCTSFTQIALLHSRPYVCVPSLLILYIYNAAYECPLLLYVCSSFFLYTYIMLYMSFYPLCFLFLCSSSSLVGRGLEADCHNSFITLNISPPALSFSLFLSHSPQFRSPSLSRSSPNSLCRSPFSLFCHFCLTPFSSPCTFASLFLTFYHLSSLLCPSLVASHFSL